MSPPDREQHPFTDYLAELARRENRAALAALRRGLGKEPGEAAEMYPYVVPFLPRAGGRWQDDAYYLVAALFAVHQQSWSSDGRADRATNLGASLARLAREVESGSIEHRFVALLNCRRDDLPNHLRHAVGLLKSREIPIDWAQLLHDIQGWEWKSRSVQRNWARAFWGDTGSDVDGSMADGIDADDSTSVADEV